ncbi:MAG: KdsC family phosphatase [Gammaproteobacteria bacterium]
MTNFIVPDFPIPNAVLERARRVRVVLFDVDGVLTDGRLILGDDGQEYKAFHSRDGHGLKMLQRSGIAVGIITGRTSKVVEHRVRDLGIQHVYQGCYEKWPVCQGLLEKLKLAPSQAAYVGDDVVDLPIMLQVGLSIGPQNSHGLVKQHAHWITPTVGGLGAAREVCELMMHAHGTYTAAMQEYLYAGTEERVRAGT